MYSIRALQEKPDDHITAGLMKKMAESMMAGVYSEEAS